MFGAANTSQPATGSIFNFSQPTLGAQPQPTLPTFGTTLTAQPAAPALGQPAPLTFGVQPQQQQLQQPTPLSNITAQPAGFSFGPTLPLTHPLTATTQALPQPTQPSLFGQTSTLFNQPQPTQPVATALQQPQGRGLGGEGGIGDATNQNKTAKDLTNLPTEWLPLVEAFKKFVKEQKTIKEENSQPRFSIEPIQEISSELNDSLRSQLQRLDVTLQKNARAVEKLKAETNALIADAEAGYRAIKSEGFSTSSYGGPQAQYSMPSSHAYFAKMLEEFERQMNLYSTQIKELDLHLDNMNKPHLPQELLTIIRKQHEALIALAAEVYAIHEEVNKRSSKAM